ncbi:hypothetical protein [Ideonella sp.]|uniref:hypothetical protein n=1 Tax=Ideonella sp. TaxID=1929293 RepID=UPI0035B1B7E2
MFTSERLLLVELHRGGSARVKKLLQELVGGDTDKGSLYADALAETGKPVLGLVCHPLSWYLALWRNGCAGKGDLHKRLTSDVRWGQLRARLKNREPKPGQTDLKQIPDGWGPERARDTWYADANDVQAFREWLQAVLMERGMRKLVDHGWGSSPIAKFAGLMTYQYFNHFVRGAENMDKSVSSMEALQALHAAQALPAHFVRLESLGSDLLAALDAAGVPLTAPQRERVAALKGGVAAEQEAIEQFYDAEARRLVARREAFLYGRLGYDMPPGAGPGKKAKALARTEAGPAGATEDAMADSPAAPEALAGDAAGDTPGPVAPTGDAAPAATPPAPKARRAAKRATPEAPPAPDTPAAPRKAARRRAAATGATPSTADSDA